MCISEGPQLPFSDYSISITAGKENPANKGLTFGETALRNAEKIIKLAERYAAEGNQTTANLVHLKDDIIVGEWRDSTYGQCIFFNTLLVKRVHFLCDIHAVQSEQ